MDFHSIQFYLRHFCLKHLFFMVFITSIVIDRWTNKQTRWISLNKILFNGIVRCYFFSISLSFVFFYYYYYYWCSTHFYRIYTYVYMYDDFVWLFSSICDHFIIYWIVKNVINILSSRKWLMQMDVCGLCFFCCIGREVSMIFWVRFNLMLQKCRCETVAI